MPFKSQIQKRKFFAMEAQGKLPSGTASQWAHHTPNIKALPEKVKSAAEVGAEQALEEAGLAAPVDAVKQTGKETRLRRDHKSDTFFNTKRTFERTKSQTSKQITKAAPRKKDEPAETEKTSMIKTAYELGILRALRDYGCTTEKQANFGDTTPGKLLRGLMPEIDMMNGMRNTMQRSGIKPQGAPTAMSRASDSFMSNLGPSGHKTAVADDDNHLQEEQPHAENPAEQLAQIFQQGENEPLQATPDNKTKLDPGTADDQKPHWGAVQQGSNGTSTALQNIQGMHMPSISSV